MEEELSTEDDESAAAEAEESAAAERVEEEVARSARLLLLRLFQLGAPATDDPATARFEEAVRRTVLETIAPDA